jgi:hypothetical protein
MPQISHYEIKRSGKGKQKERERAIRKGKKAREGAGGESHALSFGQLESFA